MSARNYRRYRYCRFLSSAGSWSVDRGAHIKVFTFSSQDHGRLLAVYVSKHSCVVVCVCNVCGRVEDVVSVLTLVRRGVAQVFHVLRVEEFREQLEVEEEEEGKEDGKEEEEEVQSGEGRVQERQPPHTWMIWR